MILVFIEHDDGELRSASRDVLAFARGVGEPVHAVAIGEDSKTTMGISTELAGVASFHVITMDGAYAPAAWAQAVVDLATELSPRAVLASSTDRGQEILSYVGAKSSLPMIANAIELELNDDAATATREQWGGTLLEQVRCTASPLLATISPTAVASDTDASSANSDSPTIDARSVTPAPADLRVRLAETVVAEGAGVSLPEAQVVVGGGRGVGDSARFSELEALAKQLGAAIGVSRAVTSAGWRPHAEQIGQTGVRIAPELYISCGVSGASQHMVGCLSAKHILAINTDADAPIMARADYAVIGDLHQIVPAITAELERRS